MITYIVHFMYVESNHEDVELFYDSTQSLKNALLDSLLKEERTVKQIFKLDLEGKYLTEVKPSFYNGVDGYKVLLEEYQIGH